MKRDLTKVSLLLLLTLSMLRGAPAFAQTEDPPAAAAGDSQSKEKEEEDEEPGKGKLSEFGDKLGKFWSVSTAFQATQSFDDNVFLVNSFRKSDSLTKLSGRMTVAYRGQHTRFEASYLPEFNLYRRYEPLNYSAHNYYQTLTHDFSRRMELHWNSSVYRAPSRGGLPFKTASFGSFRYTYYSLEALQEGLNLLHGETSVGMSYRWSPRLKMTGAVEGATTNFTVRGTPAFNPVTKEFIFSGGGKMGFDYSLNAAQSIGVTMGSTYFGAITPTRAFGSGEHQHYQTIRLTYSHQLPRKFHFNAAVGPGISLSQGSPDPQVAVHFDVGLSRQLQRSSYGVSFQRSSQVGLLQDSITGYSANARMQRMFGRKWRTNLSAYYMRSESSTGQHQLESAAGHLQIAYLLTHRITPYINYGYMHQKSLIPSPTVRNVNRNEVGIGFIYNFGVIAGR